MRERENMITGINHITLSVRDLEESFRFYTQVLDCRPVAKWPQGAYLLAGMVWMALVVDQTLREHVLPEYLNIRIFLNVARISVSRL